MLVELRLRNYRCFDDHRIPLRPRTVLVGRNNAGKSTVVEALRLLSLVANRYGNFVTRDVPEWLDLPRITRGVAPSLRGTEFTAETLYHRYGDPPARITAAFDSGYRLELYIGGDATDPQLFAVLHDEDGTVVTRRDYAARRPLPRISILPQVAPLARDERVLDEDYVRGALSSPLAPLHFRNQLRLLTEFVPEFHRIAEQTWPSLQIQDLVNDGGLQLMIRDGDFVAEVARMGHGLQMWLQTMWFLARARTDATVVLDEPDVYMHADLQRRLIRFLSDRQQQVLITTHSVEIMSEVAPDEVLVVDRSRQRSRFTTNLPAVQEIVDRLGGVSNLQLSRLWTSRRCLLLEGEDIGLLGLAHKALFPNAPEALDVIPRVPLGGWGGFPYAIGSRLFLENAGGDEIIPYCILDSDHHARSEIDPRYAQAQRAGVELHIWERKEIENYFLIPAAITRVIQTRITTASPENGQLERLKRRIIAAIDDIAEDLKGSTLDKIAELEVGANRGRVQEAMRTARQRLDAAWRARETRWGIVSGKEIWSRLSAWAQREFETSISVVAVARSIHASEIPREMASVLSSIERGHRFSHHLSRRTADVTSTTDVPIIRLPGAEPARTGL
jgi:hypothetical protein